MEKLFPHEKHLLSDCKVIKGGKISNFGTVHILLTSVKEPDENKEIGLECWSAELYRFRHNNFKAEIRDDYLVILNEAGKKVYDIVTTDIFSIRSKYICTVMSDGWLMADLFIKKYSECKTKLYLDALLSATKGQSPDIFDDRLFTKVSPELFGSKVVCLFHKGLPIRKSFVKVHTEDGLMIESETSWPLAPKKLVQAKV